MLDRDLLKRIDVLEDAHCHSCSLKRGKSSQQQVKICGSCPVGQEIKELGSRLQIKRKSSPLEKGPYMKLDDILTLLEAEVPQKVIFNALQVGQITYAKYMRNHGFRSNGTPLRREEDGKTI